MRLYGYITSIVALVMLLLLLPPSSSVPFAAIKASDHNNDGNNSKKIDPALFRRNSRDLKKKKKKKKEKKKDHRRHGGGSKLSKKSKNTTNRGNMMCHIKNFIGAWQYASPCGGGGVFELTVRCDKMEKHNKCYVRDKEIMNESDDGGLVNITEDQTCVTEGVVRTDVIYDSSTGNCLLPFVALDGGTCDENSAGFGVTAVIAAAAAPDKKNSVMKIKFSRNEGASYYNDETPYEGYFVPPSGGNGGSLLSSLMNNIGNVGDKALKIMNHPLYDDEPTFIYGIRDKCKRWNSIIGLKELSSYNFNHDRLSTDQCGMRGERGADKKIVRGDNPNGSFQRCWKVRDIDQYCWSNSAEYERTAVDSCGKIVSKHVHCPPDGKKWRATAAKGTENSRDAKDWDCGEQCNDFLDKSYPYGCD